MSAREDLEGLLRGPGRADDPDRRWHMERLPSVERPLAADGSIDETAESAEQRRERRTLAVETALVVSWVVAVAASLALGLFS